MNAKAVMMEVASKLPIERAERIAKVWNQNFVKPNEGPNSWRNDDQFAEYIFSFRETIPRPCNLSKVADLSPKNMSVRNDARIPQMGGS